MTLEGIGRFCFGVTGLCIMIAHAGLVLGVILTFGFAWAFQAE